MRLLGVFGAHEIYLAFVCLGVYIINTDAAQTKEIEMKVRIEYSRNGTGYNWFVDAWIGGGWKNVSSHKTEDEAKKQAEEIKNA